MIKGEELRNFMPEIRFENEESLNLGVIQNTIRLAADSLGVPIAFRDEQVKSGGFFDLVLEDCVVMYHPAHENDYFKFCIRVKRQGNFTFVIINDFGRSKQVDKAYAAEDAQKIREGKDLPFQIGSRIAETLFTLGRNKRKLEDELRYYDFLTEIIHQVFL